jgi:hypothetical protein
VIAFATADHDIRTMKRPSLLTVILMTALAAGTASARQMIPPGWSQFSPPPPAPPPSPRIEVPAIPHLDAPPRQPQVRAALRGAFSDRIARCLDEAAAAGLRPAARAAYSRACANR